MNNNSIQINSYLQNQMSADERAAFENRLANDEELRYELDTQRRIIDAAVNAGLKAGFAKAIRQKIIIRRLIILGIASAACVAVIMLFYIQPGKLTIQKQDIAKAETKINTQPFINPPLHAVDVPFSEYSFDAEKGDTIFQPSGSVIYFPPSALVDEFGKLIKGMVKVTYREFADPLDFFVSGIPMQYDSAGAKYNFESSGMCEINAYKDNKAVFVNQQAKPQINLSGKNKSPLHNVYFLDTVTRNWKYNGKDIITEVKNTIHSKTVSAHNGTSSEEYDISMIEPVKPTRASDDRQAFSIAIDPGSFEELYAYDNVKFEVLDESTYKRSDADEHWNNVKLERSSTGGIYNITFTNATRKVTYKVRPVLEGADYDAALKVFNEKEKLYKQALKNRLVKDQHETDSISTINKQLQEKFNAASALNDKMNALIIERNKKMRAFWKAKMEEQKKRIQQEEKIMKQEEKERQEAAKLMAEKQYLQIEFNEAKYSMDMRLSAEVMRTFVINNFGVWNCDHPQYPNNEVSIFASYIDNANSGISFTSIAVVYKGFNGITQFPSQMQIRVIPGQENMIWSVMDSSFYYFTYKDFMESGIASDTKAFTFRMRKSKKQISSYNEIRELVDKL